MSKNYFTFPGLPIIPQNVPEQLFYIFNRHFEITKEDLKSKSRKVPIAIRRHLFCYYVYKTKMYSFKVIGDMLGGRDHTTIMHSVRTAQDLLDSREPLIVQTNSKLNELLNR
jgi:chromosomal replication initiator protein